MTNLSDISVLTKKFLEGKLSVEETNELELLLLKKVNAVFFKNAIKDDYLFNKVDKKFDTNSALSKAIKDIDKPQKRAWRFPKKVYKYAAIVVLLLSITSVWYTFKGDENSSPVLVEVLEENIELLLDNGHKQLITGNENYSIKGNDNSTIGYLNNDKLSYLNNEINAISYNTLKIPYGKKFKIVLSDGTKIDLNSGTVLRYPVNFLKGEPRHVYLEEGEAYFDVTHDASRKFIVKTNDNHDVEVLGTQFNVSSYSEDSAIQTTLVQGSVRVLSKENKDMLLVPNEQSLWNKNLKAFSKKEVDTNIYTSWRNGELIFKRNSFAEIIKKLERSYGVSITGYNEKLGQEQFTARFQNETIEQIIRYFSEVYKFNYSIDRNKIFINMK